MKVWIIGLLVAVTIGYVAYATTPSGKQAVYKQNNAHSRITVSGDFVSAAFYNLGRPNAPELVEKTMAKTCPGKIMQKAQTTKGDYEVGYGTFVAGVCAAKTRPSYWAFQEDVQVEACRLDHFEEQKFKLGSGLLVLCVQKA